LLCTAFKNPSTATASVSTFSLNSTLSSLLSQLFSQHLISFSTTPSSSQLPRFHHPPNQPANNPRPLPPLPPQSRSPTPPNRSARSKSAISSFTLCKSAPASLPEHSGLRARLCALQLPEPQTPDQGVQKSGQVRLIALLCCV